MQIAIEQLECLDFILTRREDSPKTAEKMMNLEIQFNKLDKKLPSLGRVTEQLNRMKRIKHWHVYFRTDVNCWLTENYKKAIGNVNSE